MRDVLSVSVLSAMSEQADEPPKLDVSMWPDSRLRPWTIDEGLDQEISAENLSLDDRVLKTSGSKIAGKCLFVCVSLDDLLVCKGGSRWRTLDGLWGNSFNLGYRF